MAQGNTVAINTPPQGRGQQLIILVLQLSIGGIIILKDTSEDMEELVEPVAAHGPKIEEEEQEPEPPEPFEYIDD